MAKPYIAGNWKMFKTSAEAISMIEGLKAGVYQIHDCNIIVCPPFTSLAAVGKAIKDSPIQLGAQNMHPEPEGAYTGEISAPMIKDLNCRYVILGHSERRLYFKEDDAFINEKVKMALKYSLIPILCMGETLEQREAKQYHEVVKHQFDHSLKDITKDEISKLLIAYEPVWAIGTGRTATPEQAEQMQSYIRRLLKERYDDETAAKVPILYGGSVKPDNIAELMKKPNIDGALVGGASLKAETFVQIIQNAVAPVATEVRK